MLLFSHHPGCAIPSGWLSLINMINTKLILIEGMAGSGKSTAGQKLLDLLLEKEFKAEFYHEFSDKHPVIDYTKSDINSWISETIQRWKELVDNISKEKKIIILDAAFFQCTVGELLERGAGEKEINDYAFEILDIIKPANPVLIYFYQNNIVSSLKRVYEGRNQKWQNKVCTFLNNTAFGQSNIQTGYELYLQFNKDLRKITDDIFKQVKINKLAIENSKPDWPVIGKKIFQFLQI